MLNWREYFLGYNYYMKLPVVPEDDAIFKLV